MHGYSLCGYLNQRWTYFMVLSFGVICPALLIPFVRRILVCSINFVFSKVLILCFIFVPRGWPRNELEQISVKVINDGNGNGRIVRDCCSGFSSCCVRCARCVHVSEFWRERMCAARDAHRWIRFSWKRTIGRKFKFGEFAGTNYCGNQEDFNAVWKMFRRGLQMFVNYWIEERWRE